jgi:hypothetical protein
MTVITKTSDLYLLDVDTVNGPKSIVLTGINMISLADAVNRYVKIDNGA